MNRHVVVTRIERAEPTTVDGLGAMGTATVHEAIDALQRVGWRAGFIRHADHRVRPSGRAGTGSALEAQPPQ